MGLNIPKLDLTGHERATTGSRQPFPIRAERQGAYQIPVPGQRCYNFPGPRIGQLHFLVAADGQEFIVRRKLDGPDRGDDGYLRSDVRNSHVRCRRKLFTRSRPFRACVNPSTNHLDLGVAEGGAVERHSGLKLALQHQNDSALAALAGNNRRAVRPALHETSVGVHNQVAHLRSPAMASETFLLKDR